MINRPLASPAVFSPALNLNFGDLLTQIAACAERLPDNPQIINACQGRLAFTIVFFAALLKGRTNLLLPGRAAALQAAAAQKYAEARLVDDTLLAGLQPGVNDPAEVLSQLLATPAQHVAAVVFSSGTTGLQKDIVKTWQSLYVGAQINARRLREHGADESAVVATVPPWHMYGLEWTVMLLLTTELTVSDSIALFPDDIRTALGTGPEPRLLLSTPLHLRGLLDSRLKLPAIETVICATAPLDEKLAAQIEQSWATRVLEIYGCSELGSMALRLPATNPRWRFFDEFAVSREGNRVNLRGDHTGAPLQLADHLDFAADGSFSIVGRDEDMVKVGGKRGSLAEINKCLLGLPGVRDGVIFDPVNLGLPDSGRLAAVVVSDDATPASLRQALLQLIDRAFVPRPVYLAPAIPRTATGKLRRTDLAALVHKLRKLNPGDAA